MMSTYFAMRFEAGALNYNMVFAIERYKPFQADVDAILAADGYTVNIDGTVTKSV